MDSQAVAHKADERTEALYKPLDTSKREVRLLRLRNWQDTYIHGELKVFSLDNEPKFKALSYCWGEEQANRVIWINDQFFYVRPNLYAYLQIMHNEQDADWIFIDAICINQQNTPERSHQVSLMGSVYRGARLVVAWLGEDLPHFAGKEDVQRISETKAEYSTDERDKYIHVFVDSEYWSRLWILQEIGLARDVLFRRGSLQTDVERLYEVDDFEKGSEARHHLLYFTFPRADHPGSAENGFFRWRWICNSLVRQKHEEWARGSQPTPHILSEAMAMSSRQQCRIRRDRIYGLLGLTGSICDVDYSTSSITVYLQILIESLLDDPLQPGDTKKFDDILPRLILILSTLSALHLSLETPAVFVSTWLAGLICEIPWWEFIDVVRACMSMPYIGSKMKGRRAVQGAKIKFKLYMRLLPYLMRFRRIKLPACDQSGRQSIDELRERVLNVESDMRARLQQRQQGASNTAKPETSNETSTPSGCAVEGNG